MMGLVITGGSIASPEVPGGATATPALADITRVAAASLLCHSLFMRFLLGDCWNVERAARHFRVCGRRSQVVWRFDGRRRFAPMRAPGVGHLEPYRTGTARRGLRQSHDAHGRALDEKILLQRYERALVGGRRLSLDREVARDH